MDRFTKAVRLAEINDLKEWFKPGSDVLEIGGGNGYQARMIASWGCEVFSIDLHDRPFLSNSYFPIIEYDGKNVPFQDKAFDIIFSSNVFEHLLETDLINIFSEIKRVLRHDGIIVLLLPTPVWRFWTNVTYYIYLLKALLSLTFIT